MNPYEVLGVDPSAGIGEVEARYKLLLREYHPDLHQDEGEESLALCESMTRNLNDAMARIRDLRGEEGSWTAGGRTGPAAGSNTGQWPGANPFYRDPAGGGPAGHDPAGAPGDASARERDWFGNPIEHGRDEPVPCPFCGVGFDRLAAYEAHLQSAHNFRSAAPVRKEYSPNAVLRAIGALRFIPAWFVGLVAFAMWKVLGFSYFVGAISFLLLVMWTQTAKMFKRR